VGRVCGAWREVHEEGPVRCERVQLPNPRDGAVGHVLGEVVALICRSVLFDRGGAVIQGRRVLVGLTTQEPEEMLESPATGGPRVEWADRTGLPDRHFVTLAELRRRVAVETKHLRQRRCRLRTHRGVPRSGRGDLSDRPHANGMVVASGQKSLTGRGTQCRRVKARVRESLSCQPLGGRGVARPPERAGSPEPDVVEQNDKHVGRTGRRPQRLDGVVRRPRVFSVLVDRPVVRLIGDGQYSALSHHETPVGGT
jgi:hypothetical protein